MDEDQANRAISLLVEADAQAQGRNAALSEVRQRAASSSSTPTASTTCAARAATSQPPRLLRSGHRPAGGLESSGAGQVGWSATVGRCGG